MKKNILIQVGEREEQRTRLIPAEYDETGELIFEAYEETYTVTVPIMEPRNVEMTAEEIAELERMQAQMPEPVPTPEQRLDVLEPRTNALESASDDIILMMANLIGGE